MATLHISRPARGYVDRWRSYGVIVNGELRAQLHRGETTSIEVEPGQIEIFIKIDWCRSRVVQMALSPESEAHFVCRPRSVVTALYGITFARDNYVHLEAT